MTKIHKQTMHLSHSQTRGDGIGIEWNAYDMCGIPLCNFNGSQQKYSEIINMKKFHSISILLA